MLEKCKKVYQFCVWFSWTTLISLIFFVFLPADKLTDRDKLLQGGSKDDIKPRMRTAEEIRATYRKTEVMKNWWPAI